MKKNIYRQGDSLLKQMKAASVPDEAIGIWYLGQEAFALRLRDKVILIDPYLTDYVDNFPEFEKGFWVRNYPSPVEPGKLDFINFVLCTHDHLDHMDPDTIRAIASSSKGVKFIVPYPSIPLMEKLGVSRERCIGAKANEQVYLGDICITPVAAAHDVFHMDEYGNYNELSYIIQLGEIKVFHGGDMMVYPGLADVLEPSGIDVAMLPINGGDWLRDRQGIIGNMSFREAADLGAAIKADLIIPMHYDLYDVNQENPAYFADYIYHYYSGQKYHLFQPGERMVYFKEKELDKA